MGLLELRLVESLVLVLTDWWDIVMCLPLHGLAAVDQEEKNGTNPSDPHGVTRLNPWVFSVCRVLRAYL